VKKLLSVFLVLVLLGVAVVGYLFIDYTGDVKGGKGSSEKITVSVAKGSGANAVAGVLAENGIVKNEIYFKLYAKQNPVNNLQYGDFSLSADMSYEDILKVLTTVKDMRETVSITVF